MTAGQNEISPANQKNNVQILLEKINIPQLIAGPAGKAISQLIAGVTDIPLAYLERFAQTIRNRTVNKGLVDHEIAVAVGKLAAADSEILNLAMHSLIAKEYRHQKNKEDIARKTIEILEIDPPHPPRSEDNRSSAPGASEVPAHPEVNDDWLNVFEKYAEDASTERMQTLWARILAGEIRNPKTFSLKTLRFISELDQTTAELFEKYVTFVCSSIFIPIPSPFQGQEFNELIQLQDAGLLTGVGTSINQTYEAAGGGGIGIHIQGRIMIIRCNAGTKLSIQCVMLTNIAKELLEIVKMPYNKTDLEVIVERIPKGGVTSITLFGSPEEILWSVPDSPESAS